MELWIKDLKYVKAERMSCHTFCANYFRLFLYAAAFVIADKIKQTLFKDTEVQGFNMDSFIKRIMLSAVYIREKKTFVRISLSPKHRHRSELEQALCSIILLPDWQRWTLLYIIEAKGIVTFWEINPESTHKKHWLELEKDANAIQKWKK